ncbi:MAG: YggS family pyridoxal phosphate-dependent enzyme, partial [Bacillota bacterium]
LPFIEYGITNFGENRDDAFETKKAWFEDKDITWHFIGTMQTKKVKKVINDIDVLHSLDRVKLAKEIEKRREGILPCYIEVNISGEENKHGISPEHVYDFVETLKDFKHIQVIGLMGMATHTDDETIIRNQFQTLKNLRDAIQTTHPDVKGLSMGMTNDYHIALEEGSTLLRLGRILITE